MPVCEVSKAKGLSIGRIVGIIMQEIAGLVFVGTGRLLLELCGIKTDELGSQMAGFAVWTAIMVIVISTCRIF